MRDYLIHQSWHQIPAPSSWMDGRALNTVHRPPELSSEAAKVYDGCEGSTGSRIAAA